MERLACPRDDRHGPHDRDALWCWVCGKELVCETCGLTAAEHEPYVDRRCPIVRFERRELASA